MRRNLIWLACALTLAATTFGSSSNDTVKVDGGLISGVTVDGVRNFKGIPFAAPPVGDLRWRPPQPIVPWQGVKKCEAFGPECPQSPYPTVSLYYSAPQPQSEDCLYLNVWTAAKPGDKRPVMVWIHGGALTRGSGATKTYDGNAFAKKGVVLVTINYRLGPLGFLAHPDLTNESPQHSSGNYGILDQIAAFTRTQRFRRIALTKATLDFAQADSRDGSAVKNGARCFVTLESEGLMRVEGE